PGDDAPGVHHRGFVLPGQERGSAVPGVPPAPGGRIPQAPRHPGRAGRPRQRRAAGPPGRTPGRGRRRPAGGSMTTTTATPERRTAQVGIQLRDAETTDSLTMLSGRAVPYGESADIGWFLEEFAPGSLAKSIK